MTPNTLASIISLMQEKFRDGFLRIKFCKKTMTHFISLLDINLRSLKGVVREIHLPTLRLLDFCINSTNKYGSYLKFYYFSPKGCVAYSVKIWSSCYHHFYKKKIVEKSRKKNFRSFSKT